MKIKTLLYLFGAMMVLGLAIALTTSEKTGTYTVDVPTEKLTMTDAEISAAAETQIMQDYEREVQNAFATEVNRAENFQDLDYLVTLTAYLKTENDKKEGIMTPN